MQSNYKETPNDHNDAQNNQREMQNKHKHTQNYYKEMQLFCVGASLGVLLLCKRVGGLLHVSVQEPIVL